jgi:hypothetical protein
MLYIEVALAKARINKQASPTIFTNVVCVDIAFKQLFNICDPNTKIDAISIKIDREHNITSRSKEDEHVEAALLATHIIV